MKDLEFMIVLEREDDGCYTAICPSLPGCYSQGDTADEAREMIKDAIRLNVEERIANNEPVPTKVEIDSVRIAM